MAQPARTPGLSWQQRTLLTLRTILIAAAGAAVFYPLGIPVPWISGPMLAVGAAALAGTRVEVPGPLRHAVFFILGLSIGSTLTPQALEGVALWPASFALLIIGVPLVTFGAGVVLMKWRHWPRDDALLATAPGALSLIISMAASIGADVPRIAVVQTVRLAVLVMMLPPMISAWSGAGYDPLPDQPPVAAFDVVEFALLTAASLVGVFLARLVRLPTPTLLGAMIASSALHVTEAVATPVPNTLMIPTLVVLGAFIGARFQGFTFRRFLESVGDGLIAFFVAFAISAVTAVLVSVLLDLPLGQTMLAFAPGGFEVMTALAFALGLDAAYVALHQTVRFFVISFSAPFLLRKRTGKTQT